MRRWTIAVALLVAAGMMAGCGTRGDLDPPPGSAPPNKDDPFVLDKII
jgi:predicted small lipoprotein YifL